MTLHHYILEKQIKSSSVKIPFSKKKKKWQIPVFSVCFDYTGGKNRALLLEGIYSDVVQLPVLFRASQKLKPSNGDSVQPLEC